MNMAVRDIEKVLKTTRHSGYPIIDQYGHPAILRIEFLSKVHALQTRKCSIVLNRKSNKVT